MEMLFQLVEAINSYDGSIDSSNKLRDLVCFASENAEMRSNPDYRVALFSAAQKMRTFGYIIGTNKIKLDEMKFSCAFDFKQQAIQNYYRSSVFGNNLLDKRQKEIVDIFQSLSTKRLLVSAPTSFGKTFLLRELIYLNATRYNNILLVFPTVALLNENTSTMKKLIDETNLDFEIINNVYSSINNENRHIFILTPERTLQLLSDYPELGIDFFFFDEVYKIDEDFNIDENKQIDAVPDTNKKIDIKNSRAKVFRIALYVLSKSIKDYYIAGPYLNLENTLLGFKRFIDLNNVTIKQIDFEPTAKIEIDAWKKACVQHHPLSGITSIQLYEKGSQLNTNNKVSSIVNYLSENKLGQSIFYCSNPANSMKYAKEIVCTLPSNPIIAEKYGDFINHLSHRYGVDILMKDKIVNTSKYWSLITILEAGYGVHHGKLPKYIQKQILEMFNNGDIESLFCTSTIIEGVNTNAQNVIIINNSVGTKTMTSFTLKNIRGRAGRYYHHFIGRVFYTDEKQREIEKEDEKKLNFSTYDVRPLSMVDLDNTDLDDLSEINRKEKLVRESILDKKTLPDSVFIKNRVVDRKLQERYLCILMRDDIFSKFYGLIDNSKNIKYFLDNKLMGVILDTLLSAGIIEENERNRYSAIVGVYSYKRFKGLMEYQLSNINNIDEIDKVYITVFEQIKTVVEYEVPRLLCLFEAIYSQVGRLKGYNMDNFDLSMIIRFFELGVTSSLGLHLVEFGFPIDAIHNLEQKTLISKLSLEESIVYIKDNTKQVAQILDEYELSLLFHAIN